MPISVLGTPIQPRSRPAISFVHRIDAPLCAAQGPRILGGLFGSLRGFAGTVSPAAALDAAASDGNTYIIDLRSSAEKVGRSARVEPESVLRSAPDAVQAKKDSNHHRPAIF